MTGLTRDRLGSRLRACFTDFSPACTAGCVTTEVFTGIASRLFPLKAPPPLLHEPGLERQNTRPPREPNDIAHECIVQAGNVKGCLLR